MKMLNLYAFRSLRAKKTALAQKAKRGVAAIEFAMILPAFVLLMIGITEISMVMLCQHLLENATYNASRTAKTGFIKEGKTQLETVMDVLLTRLSGLSPLIDPAKVSVGSIVYGDLSDITNPELGVTGLGTASQVVVYTISYPWQTFTPFVGKMIGDEDGVIKLTSRIVVRNEPYD